MLVIKLALEHDFEELKSTEAIVNEGMRLQLNISF